MPVAIILNVKTCICIVELLTLAPGLYRTFTIRKAVMQPL
jgi:hypothetical protein